MLHAIGLAIERMTLLAWVNAAAAATLPPIPWPWVSAPDQPAASASPPLPAPPPPTATSAQRRELSGIESVASSSDPSETSSRKAQLELFVPAVRRDIYAFLLNPAAPGTPVAHPTAEAMAASAAGRVPFEAVCLGRASGHDATGSAAAMDAFVFVDRPVAHNPPDGFVFDEQLTMLTIQHLGEPTPTAIAATRAFEHYLASKVASWGDAEASRLSVEFLVAFGMEMTQRLDVNHRIRSGKLGEDDIRTLSMPPFSQFVDQGTLHIYQGGR